MLSDEERLTVVNVVASTRVAEELDLPDIAIQLNCEYEPEQFPGVVYRVTDPKLAILMFRSGRAVCTGGKNDSNIRVGIDMMTSDLRDAGIDTWDSGDIEIEVQNMVATYSLFYPEDYTGVARMDDNNTRVIDTDDGIRAATDEEVENEEENWQEAELLGVDPVLIAEAKKNEIDQLKNFGTYKLVHRTAMQNYENQTHVAKEFKIKDGAAELFSGTPGLLGIRLLLADVTTNNISRSIMIADVKGPFLYGAVARTVFVDLPIEATGGRDCVGLLRRSLYGLRDAPQIWKAHLMRTLANEGFKESPTMPAVLTHVDKQIIVALSLIHI